MENVVDADHGLFEAVVVTHVADVELDLVIGQSDAHVFLFLLVTGEDADLAHVGIEETPEYRVTEGAGAPGDHQYLVVEHRTFLNVNAARGLNEPALPPFRKGPKRA